MDQNGKPFFYLADTCWLLFQRLEHDEVDEYLRDRAAKGFTVIQAYVIRGLGKRHPDGNSSLLGESPFVDRDATRPNEAFFKNVDYIVNRANELGLVMGLVTVKSWHVNKTPEQVFNEKNAYTFGKFLGEHYKNNAVMWYPGGDSVPGKDDAVWVAMAKGLRDGSGGTQLISYHGSGQTSSSTWYHNADWLDFNTIQSGHNFRSDSFAFVSKDRAFSPAKPTVDMEPAYENHPTGQGSRALTHQGAAAYRDAHERRGTLMDHSTFLALQAGRRPFPGTDFATGAAMGAAARQMVAMRRLFGRGLVQAVPASRSGLGPGAVVSSRATCGDGAPSSSMHAGVSRSASHMDKVTGKTVKAQCITPARVHGSIGEYEHGPS